MARILVVDDDPIHLELVQLMLERGGHTVVTAQNGRQCLSRLKDGTEPVDLVITDLFMPQMDGAELIVALRGRDRADPADDPVRVPVPVIGMTGGYSLMIRPFTQTMLKLGSDAVLTKPFTEGELAAAVDRVLGTRQDGDEGRDGRSPVSPP